MRMQGKGSVRERGADKCCAARAFSMVQDTVMPRTAASYCDIEHVMFYLLFWAAAHVTI